MSIGAKPWEGGGAATVPDASETTKGKIRIATSAEATTGTDDLTAMTPLTVKERIDAAIAGGIEYKTTFNATTGLPSLANAEKGDLYKISTAGTIYGRDWAVGDHLIINEDMGGTISNGKIDKVDNTESPASESVAGVVALATNAEATAASATNKALVPSNISSIDLSSFDNDLSADDFAADHTATNYTPANANIDGHLSGIDSALASVGGNQITDVSSQTGSTFTATANVIYVVGYTTGTQTITFPDASTSTDGDLIGLTSTGTVDYSLDLVSSDGSTNDLLNMSNQTKGGTNGALSLTVKQELILFACDGTRWRQLSRELADVAKTGAYSDLSGTPTLATVATTGAYSDLSGTPTLATVATTGAYSDLTGEPTALSDLTNDLSADDFAADHTASHYTPANANIDGHLSGIDSALASAGGATDLDGLSDVTITTPTSSGQILRNNGSGQFVNTSLSIVDDTSPQLGGALDVNGNAITSASNGNVTINPDGTGDISVGADIIPDADATHTIGDEDNRFISLYSDVNGALRFKAKNDEGAQITKGQVVYIKGIAGDGETPTVGLADADDASKMPAFGLAFNTANDQAEIQIVSVGNLYGLNTSTFSVGDTLYVDTTAGGLVSTKPTGETAQLQNIGRVIRSNNGAGVIMVGGAGRSAATPNLDNGKIFLGNGSNQAVSTALSSAAVTSFNTQTGALTIGGDDLTADHTAVNYTAANANIDGHFSGIDSALALKAPLASPSLTGTPTAPTATQGDNSTQLATTAYVDTAVSSGGGGVDPTLTVVSNTTYTLSAANAPGIHIWYGASNSSTFTVTMPAIADVLSTVVSVNGDPGPTFEVYIGRGQAGDITVSAADGIDPLGGTSISPYQTTVTVDSEQWIKLVGWYASGSTQRYLMDSAAQPRDAGLTSISGLTTAADKMIYTTASDTYAVTDLTAAGRALLDDADAAAQRTTLGLGTAATSASSDFLASTAGLNDLSDVSYTAGAGIDNYVLTYDHATTSWGAEAAASGGGGWTYSAITADPANAQAGYHYSCTGSFTITLPTTGVSAGEEVRIKNMGTGTITVDPQTSNIDGSTTDYVMDIQYGAITLVSTGTHWEII